ncbi:2-polyprenyl-6-methoxyphenol hydroxylase-like FAD-dependent oxidoreductase [Streptomyces sp. 3211.6]|uniref:FAD-dependent monooxygenase n=1 Tax=Streptomyces sp. 3211.6 TaxID=1938845 RepID=UPI000EB29F90|nr:FAD-dependent monooxygenase [Streptomyces sp. 3211.6]RKT03150.1 2-polyprenyl-6-methoxyphenol hydroxylase-like FAD-dependent oxidoreductase [Streptomyces sp. 3211.6]
MSVRQRHAVVAGAGIGGLTAALALSRQGWKVTVCERAEGPAAVGAGIVLAPNALRAFEAIGFDPAPGTGSAPAMAMGLRRPGGGRLSRADPAALAARFGRTPLALHRSALTAALAAGLPEGALRYGAAVTAVDEGDGRAVVRTASGDLTADAVIAADGIHSPLRRRHFPHHPGLRYSGETAWRTVLPAGAAPAGIAAAETWGRGERFGTVPLADGGLYAYATAVVPEGYRPADVRTELLRRFGTWHHPVPALLERIDPGQVLQHDLYDLAARLPRLHHGRIAWIGDAAHAMTPNLGQGGCQAVEDAVVLAHLLAGPDVPAALAAYTRARLARTDAIRVRARRAGRVAALRHPLAVAARDLAFRAVPAGASLRALDDLFNGFTLPGPNGAGGNVRRAQGR